MEQHPVPQHISSYQFRLIGSMTIKQFGMLAAGCIIALIFYALPINSFIKWFLILSSVFLGFALAFLPIQERPLDKWIVAFLKTTLSPTQFFWKKRPQELEIFKITFQKNVPKQPISIVDRQQLAEYLATLPLEIKSPLDQEEENFIKKTLDLFELTKIPEPALSTWPTSQGIDRKPSIQKKSASKPERKKTIVSDKKKPFYLPETPVRPQKTKISTKAKFEPRLPFPQPPSQPNTLVGMVLDTEGKIVEGAIIEIRDQKGTPVRAFRTNKLGQFRSVTPLENGTYEIETEKPGYLFDIITIELTGQIVKPLEIRAKGKNEPAQNN